MESVAERKEEQILAALISNPTIKAASQVCGVSETQIRERLRKPLFKAKYDRLRRDMLEQATAYIQGVTSEAIEKIRDVMNDPGTAPQTQINAAEAILRNSLKLTEQNDILKQLAELNAAVFPK